jgi:hypothetical protein
MAKTVNEENILIVIPQGEIPVGRPRSMWDVRQKAKLPPCLSKYHAIKMHPVFN